MAARCQRTRLHSVDAVNVLEVPAIRIARAMQVMQQEGEWHTGTTVGDVLALYPELIPTIEEENVS